MNLKSMREMNHLIMESQGLQSDEFISDKEKVLTESQTDGVYVPTLPSDKYVSSKCACCGTDECKCGCEDGVCTCEDGIKGAAGTSDENIDAVMGSADTLSENLGISNSLSAKPTLKESADIKKSLYDYVSKDSDPENNDMGHFPGIEYINSIIADDMCSKLYEEFFDSYEGSELHQWNSLSHDERVDALYKYYLFCIDGVKSLNLNESADKGMVVDDESVEVAKKGANIEDEIIEKFNDMFIKEYKPQSKVTYDLDGTENKVETSEFKIPRGW